MKNFQEKTSTSEPTKARRIGESGFTLMEILIALSIFAIGILAVASMQVRSMKVNTLASNITESTTWAQDKMEELISHDWDDSEISSGNHTDTAQDGTTITWTVQDVNLDSDNTTIELKQISMQSEYRDGLGNTKRVNITSAYPRVAAP